MKLTALALAGMFVAGAANAQTPMITGLQYGAPITAEQAQAALDAAEAEARRNGWAMAIAVVDTYGTPVVLKRMTGASPVNTETALRKARTANFTRAPSKALGDRVAKGEAPFWSAIPEYIPIEGGVPIVVGGKVIGAIAGSGRTSPEDAVAASAGAAAVK